MNDSDALTPYEQKLLDDLQDYRERLPADAAPMPSSDWIIPPKRFLLGGIAGGVIAIAAAGIAVVVTGGHGSSSAPRTASQLKQRMLLAISGTDNQILYEATDQMGITRIAGGPPTVTPNGRLDAWDDFATGRLRETSYGPDGSIRSDTWIRRTGNVTTTDWLLYTSRTWTTLSHPSTRAPTVGGSSADTYRQLVERGIFKLVGTDTIDGVSALHLQLPMPAPPCIPGAGTADQRHLGRRIDLPAHPRRDQSGLDGRLAYGVQAAPAD